MKGHPARIGGEQFAKPVVCSGTGIMANQPDEGRRGLISHPENGSPLTLHRPSTTRLAPTHRSHHHLIAGSSARSTPIATPLLALWMKRPLPT